MDLKNRFRDQMWQFAVGVIIGIEGIVLAFITLPENVRLIGAITVLLGAALCITLLFRESFKVSQRSPQPLPPKPSTVNTSPGQNVVTPPPKAASRQSKRLRSPTVTVSLILLAMLLLGGIGFGIYHSVTGIHSDLRSIIWAGSQFVVVGDRAILTSPDGHTWTTQNADASYSLDDVAWSGSQFVAVGDRGTIFTSPDGHTWTPQASGTSSNLHNVVWSVSQFVAV